MSDKADFATRRGVLGGLGAAASAVAVSGISSPVMASMHSDVTVTIDNVGASAWELTAVDGSDGVADIDTRNPTLELTTGTRYRFENEGYSGHPLAFRDARNQALLSQEETGRFEDNDTVEWVDNGTAVAFTVTEELAAELNQYICTVHLSMIGGIETINPTPDEPPAAVSLSTQDTVGDKVLLEQVRLDDGGFVAIHDSSVTDEDPVESVIGVSEYLQSGSREELVVDLDTPLESATSLIAIPHRDSNGSQEFDFVGSGGDQDGLYRDRAGDVITASAEVTPVDYQSEEREVRFEAPSDGATTQSPVSVVFETENFIVEPTSAGVTDGAGVLHLLIDRELYAPGETITETETSIRYADGQQQAQIELDPGTYTLRVQAGDARHNAYDVGDTVKVTVAAATETETGSDESTSSGTATEETAGSETDTSTPTPTEDSAPGFEIIGSLGGISGAVLYAYRRITSNKPDGET